MLIQQDAPLAIRKELRRVISGVKVANSLPDGYAVGRQPFVTVTADGTPHSERTWSRENIRINVYAASEPQARQIASYIDAYLLHPRHAWGFSISAGAGLICVKDDRLGGWIAAVTVRAATNKENL